MIDIEKLKAENDRRVEDAHLYNRVFSLLPVPPKRMEYSRKLVSFAGYEVDSLPDALAIMNKFTLQPWGIARAGCTRIGPLEELSQPDIEGRGYRIDTVVEDGAPYFQCLATETGRTDEMEFFAKEGGKLFKVTIRIRNCPVYALCTPIRYVGRRTGPKVKKDVLRIQGASVIHWSYGDDACSLTYWFPDLPSFWLGVDDVMARVY